MNVPLYCTKQVVYCFFKTFVKHVKNMTYKQSKADPCLYFAWIDGAMVVLVAWVDDVMVLGPLLLVEKVQQDLETAFTCKCEGKLTKYVGSKITINRDSTSLGMVKFTQPVLVHKILEEYKLLTGPASKTPAIMGQVLKKGDGDGAVAEAQAKMYHSATATCMYMMQWSCSDIFNAMHGLAGHITAPREAHVRALMTLIKYVVSTKNRALVLMPKDTGVLSTCSRYMDGRTPITR